MTAEPIFLSLATVESVASRLPVSPSGTLRTGRLLPNFSLAMELRRGLIKLEEPVRWLGENLHRETRRDVLLDTAKKLGAAAATGEQIHAALCRSSFNETFYGPRLLARLDNRLCDIQDLAEAAALGASERFTNAVKEKLEAVFTCDPS